MRNKLLFLLLLITILFTCRNPEENDGGEQVYAKPDIPWAYEGINELKRGDILVRPNINYLPGTANLGGGYTYGHAAIVTKGAKHDNIDSLLSLTITFESHGSKVPKIYQVREIAAYVKNDNPSYNNVNFSPKRTGNRYRLRLNITESQIDSIIDFVRSQKGKYSCWNALKRFPGCQYSEKLVDGGKKENWADNSHWYCSLLVWQAVLYVTGIDLDLNGGYFVYPNDLITSSYFDNTAELESRARF